MTLSPAPWRGNGLTDSYRPCGPDRTRMGWMPGAFTLPSRTMRRKMLRQTTARRAFHIMVLEALEHRMLLVSTLSVGNETFNLAAGAAGFAVTRTGDLTPTVDVGYSITAGTAISGTNYSS